MANLKKYIRGNIKLEDVRTFNKNGTDTIESLEVEVLPIVVSHGIRLVAKPYDAHRYLL